MVDFNERKIQIEKQKKEQEATNRKSVREKKSIELLTYQVTPLSPSQKKRMMKRYKHHHHHTQQSQSHSQLPKRSKAMLPCINRNRIQAATATAGIPAEAATASITKMKEVNSNHSLNCSSSSSNSKNKKIKLKQFDPDRKQHEHRKGNAFPYQLYRLLESEAAPDTVWWLSPHSDTKTFVIKCEKCTHDFMNEFFPGHRWKKMSFNLRRWYV